MNRLDIEADKSVIDQLLLTMVSEAPMAVEKVMKAYDVHDYPTPERILDTYDKYGQEFAADLFTAVKNETDPSMMSGAELDNFNGIDLIDTEDPGMIKEKGGGFFSGFQFDDFIKILDTGNDLVKTLLGSNDDGGSGTAVSGDAGTASDLSGGAGNSAASGSNSNNMLIWGAVSFIVLVIVILVAVKMSRG